MCSSGENSQSGSSPWSGNWSRGGGTPTKEPLPTLRGATAARRAFGNLANRRGSAATGAVEPDSSSRGLEALEKKHADLAKSVEMLLAVVENMDMELVGLRKTNRHQARRLTHLAAKNAAVEGKLVNLTKVHVTHVAGCTDAFRAMSEKIVLAHEQAVEALTYSQKLDGGLERFVGELEDMADHAGDQFHKLELGQTETMKTLRTIEDAAAQASAKNEGLELKFGALINLCRGEGVQASSYSSSGTAVGTIGDPGGSGRMGFAESSSAATMKKTFPTTRPSKLNRVGDKNIISSSTADQTHPTSLSTPATIPINNTTTSISWSPASSPLAPPTPSASAGGHPSGAGVGGGGGSVAIVGGSLGGGGVVGVEDAADEGIAGKGDMQ